MSRSYYTLAVTLKPAWFLPLEVRSEGGVLRGTIGDTTIPDVSAWHPPPHVVFANLGHTSPQGVASVSEIADFITRFGVLATRENQVLEPGDQFEVWPVLFGFMQDSFRARWRSRDSSNIFHPRGGEEVDSYSLPFMRGKNSSELRLADLWTYLRFLLLQDLDGKRAKICRNKKCLKPYFVGRTNQEFCDHRCAVYASVRRFRKKEKGK